MQPFTPMVEILKPAESERFRLEKFMVTESEANLHNLRAYINGQGDSRIEVGEYMRLMQKGRTTLTTRSMDRLWMSDTPFEQRTNRHVARTANGDVFVAGLGIGMLLVPLLQKPEVKSITVVEIEQEIIDMIKPQIECALPCDKLTVLCMDVFNFKPVQKYDVVWFDIWADICADNWPEMKKLHRRFQHKINRDNPNHYMGSWERIWCQGRDNELRRL